MARSFPSWGMLGNPKLCLYPTGPLPAVTAGMGTVMGMDTVMGMVTTMAAIRLTGGYRSRIGRLA